MPCHMAAPDAPTSATVVRYQARNPRTVIGRVSPVAELDSMLRAGLLQRDGAQHKPPDATPKHAINPRDLEHRALIRRRCPLGFRCRCCAHSKHRDSKLVGAAPVALLLSEGGRSWSLPVTHSAVVPVSRWADYSRLPPH